MEDGKGEAKQFCNVQNNGQEGKEGSGNGKEDGCTQCSVACDIVWIVKRASCTDHIKRGCTITISQQPSGAIERDSINLTVFNLDEVTRTEGKQGEPEANDSMGENNVAAGGFGRIERIVSRMVR